MTALDDAVRRAAERDLPRAELSAAIVARLEALGAPRESIAAAQKIAEPRSVVVVAGQQPVLFGGPGLVWAKAWDAIVLAREIEARHGVPAVAVFWNASEDHDHAECDHVAMELGAGIEKLQVPLPGDRRMLSRVPVPEEARTLLAALRGEFPEGPDRDSALAALEPSADDSMGSWFSRIVLRLLGREGLVVVEPDTLRTFAKTVVEVEIARPGELAGSIRRADDAAVARGEERALELVREELFFLVDDTGRRLRVAREGDAWRIEESRVLSTAQLRDLPTSAFSWNVATRVLAQDVALPVAAQICGPSEARYVARLDEAHRMLDVPTPATVRRSSWRFISRRAARLARESGLDPMVVAEPGAATTATPPPYADPPDVVELRDRIARLPSSGSGAVQRRRSALTQGLEAYSLALRSDADERARTTSARRTKVADLLRPGGEPQDRVVSPLPQIAQIGLAACLDHALSGTSWPLFNDPGTGRTTVFEVEALQDRAENP